MSCREIYDSIQITNKHHTINQIVRENEPIETTLHVIAVMFNPTLMKLSTQFAKEHEIRYKLFKEFVERMERDEPNVTLYVVEMTYGDQEYIVTDTNNARHLQLHTEVPLWHRENMVTLGIKHLLPPDWQAVAWIDADIEFESTSWALDTLKILNGSRDIVQLYSHCNFLVDEVNGVSPCIDRLATSFGFNYEKQYHYNDKSKLIQNNLTNWHHGHATAINRKTYDLLPFPDYLFYNMKDIFMYACFSDELFQETLSHYVGYQDILNSLKDIVSKNNITLGYTPGVITHHFHGTTYTLSKQQSRQAVDGIHHLTTYLTTANNGILIPNMPYEENHFVTKYNDHIRSRTEKCIVLYKDRINSDNIYLYVKSELKDSLYNEFTPLWGPFGWLFLHVLASSLRQPVTDGLLKTICMIISNTPCFGCSISAKEYLLVHELTLEHIPTKALLISYLFDFHNHVNSTLQRNTVEDYAAVSHKYMIEFKIVYPCFLKEYKNDSLPEQVEFMQIIQEYFDSHMDDFC